MSKDREAGPQGLKRAWAFVNRRDVHGVRMLVYTLRALGLWAVVSVVGLLLLRKSIFFEIPVFIIVAWGLVMQMLLLLFKETDTPVGRWFEQRFRREEQKRQGESRTMSVEQEANQSAEAKQSGDAFSQAFGWLKRLYEEQMQAETEKKLRRISIEVVDQMSGQEFELFLKQLFENMGYSAKVTRYTGDQGADLVVTLSGKKTAVQAKRWGSRVGNKAIQEIFTAKTIYRCDEGMVVTNNYFTRQAVIAARRTGVHLIDRKRLTQWLEKHRMYSD